MDVDHPERDQHWDDRARQETETERLERNWSSLLQELRVVQTGVQLLTGFLAHPAVSTTLRDPHVFLPATVTRLHRDSVVNVTALVTLNKTDLTDRVGEVPASLMHDVDRGLRRLLDL